VRDVGRCLMKWYDRLSGDELMEWEVVIIFGLEDEMERIVCLMGMR